MALPPANQRSDDKLARDVLAGSSSSFAEVVRRHGPAVRALLRRRLRDEHLAEDCLQEAFVRAWRKMDRYDPRRPMRTWLLAIAWRTGTDALRRPRLNVTSDARQVADDGADPARIASRNEEHGELWARAEQLLSREAAAGLRLRYVEQMSVRHVAKVLGKSSAATKVMLFRARRKLAAAWSKADLDGEARRGLSEAAQADGETAVETAARAAAEAGR